MSELCVQIGLSFCSKKYTLISRDILTGNDTDIQIKVRKYCYFVLNLVKIIFFYQKKLDSSTPLFGSRASVLREATRRFLKLGLGVARPKVGSKVKSRSCLYLVHRAAPQRSS